MKAGSTVDDSIPRIVCIIGFWLSLPLLTKTPNVYNTNSLIVFYSIVDGHLLCLCALPLSLHV